MHESLSFSLNSADCIFRLLLHSPDVTTATFKTVQHSGITHWFTITEKKRLLSDLYDARLVYLEFHKIGTHLFLKFRHRSLFMA